MNKRYICLNGEMIPAGEPSLFHTNRAFCYGDALFETIHAGGSKLQFFEHHYHRLDKSMQFLGMEKNSLLEHNRLESSILRLLNKNNLYGGARIRLTVFRDSGGLYTPAMASCSFLAEAVPLPCEKYRLNEKGLMTTTFTSLFKQADGLANLKTSNSLLYVMAGMFKEKTGMDECFILNTEKRLAESISSNIFLMQNGILYTPALTEGCIAGIMRFQIIRIAERAGIECREVKMEVENLLTADECFLTNSIAGIRWVVAFGQKRYYSKTSRRLIPLLNDEAFG
jgi:branched-subunit amino acid aminotransferase/4-amino-4-deoxychorismate lyase